MGFFESLRKACRTSKPRIRKSLGPEASAIWEIREKIMRTKDGERSKKMFETFCLRGFQSEICDQLVRRSPID